MSDGSSFQAMAFGVCILSECSGGWEDAWEGVRAGGVSFSCLQINAKLYLLFYFPAENYSAR
jgi:hypothetical protein